MVATWFDGEARDFIAASRLAFSRGALAHHILGGSSIDVRGTRAVAQTKMILSVRASIDGIPCDVECFGRFYDLLEKVDDVWKISVRRCIYEKDRIDPVDRSMPLRLDVEALSRYPEGYRHLAYAQAQRGLTSPTNLPGLHGAEVEQLYASGAAWLAGVK
jgi:hypothetical protein